MLKLNSSNSNSIQLNGYGYGCVPKIQFFVGLSSKIYPTYQSHRKVKKFKGASSGNRGLFKEKRFASVRPKSGGINFRV